MRSSIDQPWEYGSQIEPTVKPVLALSQVAVAVFFKVKGMISPVDGGLQVAKDGIEPGKTFHVSALTSLANNFALMRTAGLCNSLETPEPVRYYGR